MTEPTVSRAKPQIILRVDDVGRKPGDKFDKGTDGDLDYFLAWRDACTLGGFPVIYGVTPAWLTRKGYKRLKTKLSATEKVALHGWNHARGLVLPEQMRVGAMLLDTNIYIPPFNEYSADTMQDWHYAGGRYFLGGYERPLDHPYQLGGQGVYHIPACKALYGHAVEMPTNFEAFLPTEYPVVMTLHVPWDKYEDAARVVNAVREYLVPLTVVDDYLRGPKPAASEVP